MKILKYVALAVTVVLLAYQFADAGWDWERVRGNKQMTSKEISLEKFDEVFLASQGAAYIESGSENKIIIEGEENILAHIEVEVRGHRLVIETEEGFNIEPRMTLKYRITTTQSLEQLTTGSSGDIFATLLKNDQISLSILSSGDIEVEDIDAKNIEVSSNSSGDVKLKHVKAEIFEARINSSGDIIVSEGNVVEQDIRINSSGDFRAINVASEEAYVKINSSGDVHINVSDYLRVRSNSSGDVRLLGNPKIDSNMNSSGKIQRASI